MFKDNFKQFNFNPDAPKYEIFRATQGDTKSQGFNITVFLGGKKKVIINETMMFLAEKPDGTRVIDNAVKDGEGFKVELKNQVFATAGLVECSFVLLGSNGEKLADTNFQIFVEKSLEDGAIISKDERSVLDRAFDLTKDVVPRLEEIDIGLMENLQERFDNIFISDEIDGVSALEVIDARQGKANLGANLLEMKEGIKINKAIHPSLNAIWKAPTLPDTLRGNGKIPSGYDPDEAMDALIDPLVDGEYVKKSSIGKDQSGTYTIRRYDFTPLNYEKTIVITACTHGNEYSGFYSLTQILDLLVNEWENHPQLAYVRKNVRLVVIPILNMWGFANQKRQNSRLVDLNRNTSYGWELFSYDKVGDTYYKGESEFSEIETRNLMAVFDGLDDVVAYLDFHTIVTIGLVDYCIYYPRFTEQNNEPFTKMLWALHEEPEKLVYGSSSLPSLTNYVSDTYKATSLLCEVINGVEGSTRSSEEMTRMARFYGNIIFKASTLEYKGDIENLSEPKIVYYSYDRSEGSILGEEGSYEGVDGERVPINKVNHDASSLRTFTTEQFYSGTSSMKLTASNQINNARVDMPDLLLGRHYLWMMRRKVTDLTSGEFRMSIYTIDSFSNRTDFAVATSVDEDWQLIGGVFRGRNEGVRLLYGNTSEWTGTAYVDENMLVEISREEFDGFEKGDLTLEDMAIKYQFEYQVNPPKIMVEPNKNFQTLMHFEDRSNVEMQGLYIMDGFITFTITERAEVGWILQTYQPFSPESKWRETKDDNTLGVRRWFEAGTHTVPIMSQLFAEVTNITAEGRPKRTGEMVLRLRGLLSNGECVVENVRYRSLFLQSNSGKRYVGFNSTGRENLPKTEKYETIFPTFIQRNEDD